MHVMWRYLFADGEISCDLLGAQQCSDQSLSADRELSGVTNVNRRDGALVVYGNRNTTQRV